MASERSTSRHPDKDTTGVYEGYYVPGNYVAVEHIIGIPIAFNGAVDIRAHSFLTGSVEHQFSLGITFSSAGNNDPGLLIDAAKPRWQGSTIIYHSERPVNLKENPPLLTSQGYYLQDKLSGRIAGKRYSANLGMRLDVQNGFLSYAPGWRWPMPWESIWG